MRPSCRRGAISAALAAWLLLAGCGSAGPAPAPATPAPAPTADARPAVILLVRHAETRPDAGRDPELSRAGRARAERLAEQLRDSALERVHTSPYQRTRGTAAAVAAVTGLEPVEYDPRDLPALATRLLEEGGRHLVVGHSNTTPELVRLLGGDPGPPLPETEYDRLYVLTASADGVQTLLLRY